MNKQDWQTSRYVPSKSSLPDSCSFCLIMLVVALTKLQLATLPVEAFCLFHYYSLEFQLVVLSTMKIFSYGWLFVCCFHCHSFKFHLYYLQRIFLNYQLLFQQSFIEVPVGCAIYNEYFQITKDCLSLPLPFIEVPVVLSTMTIFK